MTSSNVSCITLLRALRPMIHLGHAMCALSAYGADISEQSTKHPVTSRMMKFRPERLADRICAIIEVLSGLHSINLAWHVCIQRCPEQSTNAG